MFNGYVQMYVHACVSVCVCVCICLWRAEDNLRLYLQEQHPVSHWPGAHQLGSESQGSSCLHFPSPEMTIRWHHVNDGHFDLLELHPQVGLLGDSKLRAPATTEV